MAIGNMSKKKTSVDKDVHDLVLNLKKEILSRTDGFRRPERSGISG